MQTTELENVFRDRYGYNTKRVVLDCKYKKPQAQLQHATSQFIYDHDGSHRNTLLIVYYSGHGGSGMSKVPKRLGQGLLTWWLAAWG